MNLEPLIPVLSAASAGLLQYARARFGTSPARRQLHRDLQLYKELPEKGNARAVLEAHIEASVKALLSGETVKRRDPVGMSLALIFLAGAVYLGYQGVRADSWAWAWWIGSVPLGVFGVVGLSLDAVKAERDEKGTNLDDKRRRAARKTRR